MASTAGHSGAGLDLGLGDQAEAALGDAAGGPALLAALQEGLAQADLFAALVQVDRARRAALGGPMATGLLGSDAPPHRQGIALKADIGLRYPGTAMRRLLGPGEQPEGARQQIQETGGDSIRFQLAVFGLLGAMGVLPEHYTQKAARSNRDSINPLVSDFFDMLSQRLAALFHRVAVKHSLSLSAQEVLPQTPRVGPYDGVTELLLSLSGLADSTLRGRLPLPDLSLIALQGGIGAGRASAPRLKAVLEAYLGVAVTIRPNVPRWVRLSPDQQTSLAPTGAGSVGGAGGGAVLGRSFLAGDQVLEAEGTVEVTVHTGTFARYRRFMASGPGLIHRGLDLQRLEALTRLLVGPGLRLLVRLTLPWRDVPPARPGSDTLILGACFFMVPADPLPGECDQTVLDLG